MKKILFVLLALGLTISNLAAHTSHYQNFKKIEMEILKDGTRLLVTTSIFSIKKKIS